MLKGDCNKCEHRDLPEDSITCIECGIAGKNYKPIKHYKAKHEPSAWEQRWIKWAKEAK